MVIYSLIGLVVNVLVAWGFAATWTVSGAAVMSFGLRDGSRAWSVPEPFPHLPDGRTAAMGAGADFVLEWARFGLPVDRPRIGPQSIYATRCRFGWPVRCLGWHEVRDPDGVMARGLWIDLPGSGLADEIGIDIPRRLPLEPVWSGLLINTVIYGGSLGVGVWLIRAAHRSIRHRRGRCVACGYDTRGLAGRCPECGWGRIAETRGGAETTS